MVNEWAVPMQLVGGARAGEWVLCERGGCARVRLVVLGSRVSGAGRTVRARACAEFSLPRMVMCGAQRLVDEQKRTRVLVMAAGG